MAPLGQQLKIKEKIELSVFKFLVLGDDDATLIAGEYVLTRPWCRGLCILLTYLRMASLKNVPFCKRDEVEMRKG
jgi:hypothetical protein